jgi:hypothetical protein
VGKIRKNRINLTVLDPYFRIRALVKPKKFNQNNGLREIRWHLLKAEGRNPETNSNQYDRHPLHQVSRNAHMRCWWRRFARRSGSNGKKEATPVNQN